MPLFVDGDTASQGPTGAAIGFVTEGWDFFENKIVDLTNRALSLITDLSFVPMVEPVTFTIDFPEVDGLTAFVAPERPVLAPITHNAIDVPEPPSLPLPNAPIYVEGPVFDVASPPAINLPSTPGAFDVPAPGDAPILNELALPDAPVFVIPAVPTFTEIVLPEMPDITLPTFAGNDPGAAPTMPNLSDVGFTEEAYVPTVLNDMVPVIRNALASGQLLAAPVEQAMFERARKRIRSAAKGARQAIDELFTTRGFKQPPGMWAGAHADQVESELVEIGGINRDLTIQFHTEAIKNVQFAITQGIALEQVLIGQHSAIMDRALQSTRLLLDTHVALFNGQIAGYNASIERYRADVEVFRGRIEGEIARLEAYKAQVQGQLAVAEVNKAAADVYESQIRGVVQLVEVYKGQIAAVQAQSEMERNRIEGYRATVQAYAERVRAFDSQWGAYKTAVEAQQAGFKSYEIGVNAFGARVTAWAEGERVKSGRYETDVKAAGMVLDGYRARIQGVLARLQDEQGRVAALSAMADAQARIYSADGQIASVGNDSNTRAFEAQINYYDRRSAAKLSEAQIKIQDAARLLTGQIEAARGAAQAMSTLAASAMSAVNFSAGVNGSGSENSGFSYSLAKSLGWSWNGESSDNDNYPSF